MTTSAIRSRAASGEGSTRGPGHRALGGTGQVVAHVRDLIERGHSPRDAVLAVSEAPPFPKLPD